jgi:hypothetical protein
MIITQQRYSTSEESTLGLLFVNQWFQAYSLEDTFKPFKAYGITRIPAGIYKAELRTEGSLHKHYQKKFPHFHKGMIWIRNVPNFKWIMYHIGNESENTDGCPLVGDSVNSNVNQKGFVSNSTKAYERFYKTCIPFFQKEDVFVYIKDSIFPNQSYIHQGG